MTNPARFLTYLSGTWHIDRQIDVKGRAGSRFQGLAHMRPTDIRGTLSYHEEGRFIGEDVTLDGYRDYIYKVREDTLTILFADAHRMGEHYVTLNFSGGATAQDSYLCGGDTYSHSFEIISAAHFITATSASGPEKDYRLTTDYRRL